MVWRRSRNSNVRPSFPPFNPSVDWLVLNLPILVTDGSVDARPPGRLFARAGDVREPRRCRAYHPRSSDAERGLSRVGAQGAGTSAAYVRRLGSVSSHVAQRCHSVYRAELGRGKRRSTRSLSVHALAKFPFPACLQLHALQNKRLTLIPAALFAGQRQGLRPVVARFLRCNSPT